MEVKLRLRRNANGVFRQLNQDKDFALVRTRADFKKLWTKIAAKP
jgi:hypothetical protein